MVVEVHYPANPAEWYAKGKFDNGVYFEVPAVFNEDDSCNVPATNAKIDQFEQFLNTK